MYIPKSFAQTDLAVLHQFMQTHNFAVLVSQDEQGALMATHLPLMLDVERNMLIGHLARANPQWKAFTNEREVLVIFQGPHTYISPSWYEQATNVPTWNYAVVHAYGKPRVIEDSAAMYAMLRELVDHHEASFAEPWAVEPHRAHAEKLMPAIVGLEIEITRLEGKYKLSQNRSETDQQRVIDALSTSDYPPDRRVAILMREERNRQSDH